METTPGRRAFSADEPVSSATSAPLCAPLSSSQERLWLIDQLGNRSPEYTVLVAWRVRGVLNRDALSRAISAVVARHEILRTRFDEIDGQPVQIIGPPLAVPVEIEDMAGHSFSTQQHLVTQALRREKERPFDLAAGPLLRLRLLCFGESDHVLVQSLHHIIWDGWSQAVFYRELETLYECFCEGRGNPLPPLKMQFSDFARWERERLGNGSFDAGLGYWREHLRGVIGNPGLPSAHARPPAENDTANAGAGALRRILPVRQVEALKRLARACRATLQMTLTAAFGVVFSRYSGTRNVVVGYPVANRPHVDLEVMIGLFVNTIPARIRLTPGITIRELIDQLRKQSLDSYQYQDVPLASILADSAPHGGATAEPLIETVFAFQNAPSGTLRLKDVETERVRDLFTNPEDGNEGVRFGLEVHAIERSGQLLFSWLYHEHRIEGWLVEKMASHYIHMLEIAASEPDRRVDTIDLLTAAERKRLLVDWNRPPEQLPELTLAGLFEQQARQSPHATAVVMGTDSMTYGELNDRANQLAHYLLQLRVGPEDLVGIAMERSEAMIVAVIGILKTGAAYLPLDPEYPQERLQFLVTDAKPACILTNGANAGLLPSATPVICLDAPETAAALEQHPVFNPARRLAGPDNAAYLMYTSGSTGKPKGVLVTNRNVTRLVHKPNYVCLDSEVILHCAPLSFDASTFEIFGSLLHGGTLAVCGARVPSLDELGEAIRQHKVTTMWLTAGVFHVVMTTQPDILSGVRQLLVGGDVVGRPGAEQFFRRFPECALINGYGPTETTTFACCRLLRPADCLRSSLPIGSPISNTQVYVLDADLLPLPPGVVGDLYIAGAGLSRGYWNRPGATAEVFVPNPFHHDGSRMYRTGDRARWQPDGVIEFMGRADQQVKIRGFRVEPAEIEAALMDEDGVSQAIVIPRDDGQGSKRLLAYIVPERGSLPDPDQLLERIGVTLPGFMQPAAIVLLEDLPLTPNGKIDRNALPDPRFRSQGYRAPGSEVEKTICGLVAELLQIERAGLDDNFFDLGGHSLLGIRLMSRLRKVLACRVGIRTLFEAPTLGHLAAVIDHDGHPSRPDPLPLIPGQRPDRLPLSLSQQQLWFIDRLRQGASSEYHVPAAFRLKGPLDVSALTRAINIIVDRHEILRTSFSEVDGEPFQVISATLEIPVPVTDLTALNSSLQFYTVMEELRKEWDLPFDLKRCPLIRFRLLKLADMDHVLLRTWHHIVMDGWSLIVFDRELAAIYASLRDNSLAPLESLPLQYADYAGWQQARAGSDSFAAGLDYWRRRLEGLPGRLELPSDRPRRLSRDTLAGIHRSRIPRVTRAALRTTMPAGTTLYMTMMAALAVLLSRYAGMQDIAIGTTVAGRSEPQLESLIGFFINTLVIRLPVARGSTVKQLLTDVRSVVIEAFQHQETPFVRLVEELSPGRSGDTSPLVQVIFNLQNEPSAPLSLHDLEVTPVTISEGRARFELELHAVESDGAIELMWVYNSHLYDAWRIEQMARHYATVLGSLAGSPNALIGRLPLFDEQERNTILQSISGPAVNPPGENIVELFERQVSLRPSATAVIRGRDHVTYSELNRCANVAARALLARGAGFGDVVAIRLPRETETIAVLLAVLKVGAAYLPLDLAYPQARVEHMLQDSDARWLVTPAARRGEIMAANTQIVSVEALLDESTSQPGDPHPRHEAVPSSVVYIIYTSGSTGSPKGTTVPQEAVVRLVRETSYIQFGPGDRIAQASNISFDAATFEIWGALLNGATLVILSREEILKPRDFAQALTRDRITTLFLTTALFNEIVAEIPSAFRSVNNLLFGGEVANPYRVRQCLLNGRPRRLLHVYGPTENTTFSTWCEVSNVGADDFLVPIGQPLTNSRAYVLDSQKEPVPPGVAGELYVAGAGLAHGYHRRPAMTASVFQPDPFGPPGTRMYKTGDLVRLSRQAELEFVGRVDQQVKIRGFRVEPDEVEAVLERHPSVDKAAVVVRINSTGQKELDAYVVLRQGAAPDAAELRRFACLHLPDYMVPRHFVPLSRLPLTANGKLDRPALPLPIAAAANAGAAPRNPAEAALAGMFAEILGLPAVGIEDSFFDLGGHSLAVTRLVSRIRTALGREVPILDVFESPTVAGLARRLGEMPPARAAFEPRARPRHIPLAPSQRGVWYLHQLDQFGPTHNVPVAFRLQGCLDVESFQLAMEDLVARHESLRTLIVDRGGVPRQVILDASSAAPGFELHDAVGQNLNELLGRAARESFDLSCETPLRIRVFRTGIDEHVVLLLLHHIAFDGSSLSPLCRDFSLAYAARLRREFPDWPAPPAQYADYAVWQAGFLGEESDPDSEISRQLAYWRSSLAGLSDEIDLPCDRLRSGTGSGHGDGVSFRLPLPIPRKLAQIAAGSGASLFMALQAGVAALLARFGAGTDIPLGVPVAGRTDAAWENLVGLFLNTLVVRTNLSGDPDFRELLDRVRRTTLAAYAHQDAPFDRIVQYLNPARTPGRHPLFQVMVNLYNNPESEMQLPGLSLTHIPVGTGIAKFDLLFNFYEERRFGGDPESMGGYLEYSSDLFDRSTVITIVGSLIRLFEEVTADPTRCISCLDLLTPSDHRKISEWNETSTAAPDGTILDWIEAQAAERPRAVAVAAAGPQL